MHRWMTGIVGLAATFVACAPPQPLVIMPAKMGAPPSTVNHRDGSAYVFVENGRLQTRLRFDSVRRWGLSITARAQAGADGSWPQLRVELDDVPPQTIVVGDRLSIPYRLTFGSEPGFADIRLSLLNGTASGSGPVLIVERVELTPL